MRIAILGTRGIPGNYGGFETFAEKLSTRLVERGHNVTVYCRSHHAEPGLRQFRGADLTVLPTIRHKYLDTIVHTAISALHAAFRRFDAVLVCNAANSPFIPVLTWSGTPVAINVDGLERKRKKWNRAGRAYYRLCERASVWFASEIVTDAAVIHDYYRSTYNAGSTMIAYGADVERTRDAAAIGRFGVEPEQYFLYVSRLEPENNAAMVVDAFRKCNSRSRLVIVGDAPYANDYKKKLLQLAAGDERIIFTGFVFGADYKALQQNAFAYIHATEVGGTHPALIEAMGYGNCVLAYATPENLEVLGNAGLTFSHVSELTDLLNRLSVDGKIVSKYRDLAQARVREHYDWDRVTDEYEKLFAKMTDRK